MRTSVFEGLRGHDENIRRVSDVLLCQRKMRSVCAKGVSLGIVGGGEGTRWDGSG